MKQESIKNIDISQEEVEKYLQENPDVATMIHGMDKEQQQVVLGLLKDKLQAEQQAQRQQETIQTLENRIGYLMYDSVTDLLKRNIYFEYMDELLADISEEDLQKPDYPLYITVADMAYLSYFNQPDLGGHATGDYVLSLVGNEIKKEYQDQEAYRIGGDEFLTIGRDSKDVIKQKNEKIKQSLKDQQLEISDKSSRIRIDYGIAHISEGWRAFQKLCAPDSPGVNDDKNCSPEKRNREVAALTLEIADRRSFAAKAKSSLFQLREMLLKKNESEFDRWLNFLGKGTGIVSRDDFLAKFENIEDKNVFAQAVKKYIEELLKNRDQHQQSRFLFRQEIVNELADKVIFEELFDGEED